MQAVTSAMLVPNQVGNTPRACPADQGSRISSMVCLDVLHFPTDRAILWLSRLISSFQSPFFECPGNGTPSVTVQSTFLSFSSSCAKLIFLFHVHTRTYLVAQIQKNDRKKTVTVLLMENGRIEFNALIVCFIVFVISINSKHLKKHTKTRKQFQLFKMSAPASTLLPSVVEVLLPQQTQSSTFDVVSLSAEPMPHLGDFLVADSVKPMVMQVPLCQQTQLSVLEISCLPVKPCSQSESRAIKAPLQDPVLTKARLECQKCHKCENGYRQRSNANTKNVKNVKHARACICGHTKQWHTAVKTHLRPPLVQTTIGNNGLDLKQATPVASDTSSLLSVSSTYAVFDAHSVPIDSAIKQPLPVLDALTLCDVSIQDAFSAPSGSSISALEQSSLEVANASSSPAFISPEEIVILQEYSYPDSLALCLPIEFTSNPGSINVEVPSTQSQLVPLADCSKCNSCTSYRPRSRNQRSSLCKCGHTKKSHISVNQASDASAQKHQAKQVVSLPASSMFTDRDIAQRRACGNMRSVFDFGLVYRTEPKQVTSLRNYPLSTINLQKKSLQFFNLSASRASTEHIIPHCGIIFTGLPTPSCKAELLEVLNTLLCISPYSSLLDGDQCTTWIQSSASDGSDSYLHLISHPNNGALFLPCRADINVHSHLAADLWDHSESNTHQPLYSEFAFHSLGPTIKYGLGLAPPLPQKRPWMVGVQLINGRIYEPMFSCNIFPPDVMNHVPLYCLFLDATYVADAAYNLDIEVKLVLQKLPIPSSQHVQVIISRLFLVPEDRAVSVYLLTVQFNQVTSNNLHSNSIRDILHSHFLSSDKEDISPVLIGAHLFYCSALQSAVIFLARRMFRKKCLLTENLYQPLAVTISTSQTRQTEFVLKWLETKTLGVTPILRDLHLVHPRFPILQDLCFRKQMVRVIRHTSRFTEHSTEIRLKYSVPLSQKLEDTLTALLRKHDRDFFFSSSGFDDNELAYQLSQEYKDLRIHETERLTADDILLLQEDYDNNPDSGIDRLAISHTNSKSLQINHG